MYNIYSTVNSFTTIIEKLVWIDRAVTIAISMEKNHIVYT